MKHRKKLLAPIVIAALLLLYYAGVAVLFLALSELPGWLQPVLILPPLALCGVVVYVLAQRIREIRSGEEDDLDQY